MSATEDRNEALAFIEQLRSNFVAATAPRENTTLRGRYKPILLGLANNPTTALVVLPSVFGKRPLAANQAAIEDNCTRHNLDPLQFRVWENPLNNDRVLCNMKHPNLTETVGDKPAQWDTYLIETAPLDNRVLSALNREIDAVTK